MRRILRSIAIAAGIWMAISFQLVKSQTPPLLYLAYPPENHQTTAAKIFLIGTASKDGEVFVNDRPIERTSAGHFAPSFPLKLGENLFELRHQQQEIRVKVTRISAQTEVPQTAAFAKDSLFPATNISRLPGETICFGAVASTGATVSVSLGDRSIPLAPRLEAVELPPNHAVLTAQNEPIVVDRRGQYRGCTAISKPGNLGVPIFRLIADGKKIEQPSAGGVEILSPKELEVIEVTASAGVARTGPGSDYSRLTPLPKGTRASVTGKEGEWLRLDYGGWIRKSETETLPTRIPPQSIIRSITSRQIAGATQIIFPLQTPVPIAARQGEKTFTLTLYNTIAQTDTIRLDDDPLIKGFNWQQIAPDRVEYNFYFKSARQWGYELEYEGTSLILSLRHSPLENQKQPSKARPLSGIKILLDPGHGGAELGAKGPTGYPEKDLTLAVSKLLESELLEKGARVLMTRETDKDVSLPERVETIDRLKPAIALSIHYNALPDDGDAINTAGVGTFWYHPQARDLAVFLHNYLVTKLDRPSYGIYWNNLALTRPHSVPAVLLELGFAINPEEFEWIIDSKEQKKLAKTLAEGIVEWFVALE